VYSLCKYKYVLLRPSEIVLSHYPVSFVNKLAMTMTLLLLLVTCYIVTHDYKYKTGYCNKIGGIACLDGVVLLMLMLVMHYAPLRTWPRRCFFFLLVVLCAGGCDIGSPNATNQLYI
jgi:hypothetical protein